MRTSLQNEYTTLFLRGQTINYCAEDNSSQIYLCSRESLPQLQDSVDARNKSRARADDGQTGTKQPIQISHSDDPGILIKKSKLRVLRKLRNGRKLVNFKRRKSNYVRSYSGVQIGKTVKCKSSRDFSRDKNIGFWPNPALKRKICYGCHIKPSSKCKEVDPNNTKMHETFRSASPCQNLTIESKKALFLQDEEVFCSETQEINNHKQSEGRKQMGRPDLTQPMAFPVCISDSTTEIFEKVSESSTNRMPQKSDKPIFIELPGISCLKNKDLTISSGECYKTPEPSEHSAHRVENLDVQHSSDHVTPDEKSIHETKSFFEDPYNWSSVSIHEESPKYLSNLRIDHEIRISDADGHPPRLFDARGQPLTDNDGYLRKDDDGNLLVMLDSGGIPLCCSSGEPIYMEEGQLWLTQQHLFDVIHKSRRSHKLCGDGGSEERQSSTSENSIKEAILSKIIDSTPYNSEFISTEGNKLSFFHPPSNATYEISINWEDKHFGSLQHPESGRFGLSDFDRMYSRAKLTETIQNRDFEVWSLENRLPIPPAWDSSIRENSRKILPPTSRHSHGPRHYCFHSESPVVRPRRWFQQIASSQCGHCRSNKRE